NVFRQIRLEIEVHHLPVPRQQFETCEVTREPDLGVVVSDRAADIVAEQHPLFIRLEVADLIEVAAALVACGASEEILAGRAMWEQRPDHRRDGPAGRWRPAIERRNSRMRRGPPLSAQPPL